MKHQMKQMVLLFLLMGLGIWGGVACNATTSSPETNQTTATTEPQSATDTTALEQTTNDTTQQTETDDEQETTYTDLSSQVQPHVDTGVTTVNAKSRGKLTYSNVALDFTKASGQYILSSTKITAKCHDVATCTQCGYVATHGGAYLMSSEGLDQGGVTVTLATPMLATSVTKMTVTFKTTADAPNSSMRILKSSETNNAAFINTCASMSGGVSQWKTIDLGVDDFTKLADTDGYIRSFQMYFRNKDKVDCYVQSIEFEVSPQDLLVVDQLPTGYLYAEGAIEAIADIIAGRLTDAGIKADIQVKSTNYRGNSSGGEGTMTYLTKVTLSDGTVISQRQKVTIPALSGVWLDNTDGAYGSSHDAKGQYQNTFDPCGMVQLTDNVLSCEEGVKTMAYAVVAKDVAYDDKDIVWLAPQVLTMSETGLSQLFINAYMDYGSYLTEGSEYHFLLRGETNRDNYILHLDIPFTYEPLFAQGEAALLTAQEALQKGEYVYSKDKAEQDSYLVRQFKSLIDNDAIVVDVAVQNRGINSMRVGVSLRYKGDISATDMPAYTLDGQPLTAVYDFDGAFFTSEIVIWHTTETPAIALTAPYDGCTQVVLASDYIEALFKAPVADLKDVSYGYMAGEHCTPVPVTLTWTDENPSKDKTYTVYVSAYEDMRNATKITVTGTKTQAQIDNLNVGKQYYWQVKSGGEASLVYTFTTADGYARFMNVGGISNIRDIGGYTTVDGKKVKQNLAYRAAELDGVTSAGLQVALQGMGIVTDLDLRGGKTNPLGVKHMSIAMQWYEHIFEEDSKEVVRQTIAAFANRNNYPMIFHCSMGRDRTGTTAFLILGLLGVDEETLYGDYYASFFSEKGSFSPSEFPLLVINMQRLVDGLSKFGGKNATLQEQIEAYLLHIGVTPTEIQNIRNILLED